jgi:hypothetical protein
MLKQTKNITEVVKDKKIKQLVFNILEDKKKHHRVLKDVFEILNKESKEWDAYVYDLIESTFFHFRLYKTQTSRGYFLPAGCSSLVGKYSSTMYVKP